MNFLLIGCCGKMGKEVVSIIEQHPNHKIVAGIDIIPTAQTFPVYKNTRDITESFDAIIDFSTSSDKSEYVLFAKKHLLPYGCFSTTCTTDDEQNFKTLSKTVPVLLCKNTSIGINLLYDLVDLSSKHIPDSDVAITEIHHKHKKDSPSGTAKEIEALLSNHHLPFQTNSLRVGNEAGKHIVQFFLEDEIIEISHTAKSRKIFAIGAVKMMEKLKDKKPKIYKKL